MNMMRSIAALLIGSSALMAQSGAVFDPRDISGNWDRSSRSGVFGVVPAGARGQQPQSAPEAPFTGEGKTRYDENKPGHGPKATNGPEWNDPIGKCEPLGLVRHLNTEVGVPHSALEIVQLPGRVIQFFEYRHDWREIWADGRTLPTLKEVDPSWNGYSVGRWEGDTFVVETVGLDERSWIDNLGYPHSEDARLEERYRRVDADTLELTETITDPVTYTRTLVSDRKLFKLNRTKAAKWRPQIYCVPSEEFTLYELIRYGGVSK
jgi:hypothetical protein